MSYINNSNTKNQRVFLNTLNSTIRIPRYQFNLQSHINTPLNQNCLISLNEFTMPNILRNVTKECSTISFYYDNIERFSITLPFGIYNAFTFRDYLNYQFTALGKTIVCVYNYKTYRMSFASDRYIEIINEPNYPTDCARLIGIKRDQSNRYIFPVISSAPLYTIHLQTIDFRSTSYIFIKILEIPTDNLNSYGHLNNAFMRIPVNCPHGSTIFYRPTELIRYNLGQFKTDKFTVELFDEWGVNLNTDFEFQMLLLFEYIYTQSDDKNEQGLIYGTIPYFLNKQYKQIQEVEEDEEIFGI